MKKERSWGLKYTVHENTCSECTCTVVFHYTCTSLHLYPSPLSFFFLSSYIFLTLCLFSLLSQPFHLSITHSYGVYMYISLPLHLFLSVWVCVCLSLSHTHTKVQHFAPLCHVSSHICKIMF